MSKRLLWMCSYALVCAFIVLDIYEIFLCSGLKTFQASTAMQAQFHSLLHSECVRTVHDTTVLRLAIAGMNVNTFFLQTGKLKS